VKLVRLIVLAAPVWLAGLAGLVGVIEFLGNKMAGGITSVVGLDRVGTIKRVSGICITKRPATVCSSQCGSCNYYFQNNYQGCIILRSPLLFAN
jgi:hypothetical protein